MYRVHKVEVIKLNLIWIKFYCRINFERHDWNFDIIISFDMQRASAFLSRLLMEDWTSKEYDNLKLRIQIINKS